jgi:hypothetical protein
VTSGALRRTSIPLVVAIALAAVATIGSGTVSAHDHKIPRVRLISEKAWQRGRLQSFCWVTGDLGTGEACAGGPHTWPDRDVTPGGRRAIVRIRKVQRPRKLRLTSWPKLHDNGSPSGDGRRIEYTLETTLHNGDVVQEARFNLPDKPGHYYLEVYGVWPDTVSNRRQNATWNLHLKLR